MTEIVSIDIARWDAPCSAADQHRAIEALENGDVVLLPRLAFVVDPAENDLLSPSLASESKNVTYEASTGALRGCRLAAGDEARLRGMLQRFVGCSRTLLTNLLPAYRADACRARATFRPVEIAGRSTSWRKDDTRLHVDSFPASPTRGARILRVFSNIDPRGRPRTWRLGEPFETVVRRYRGELRGPLPGTAPLLQWLRITKGRRSPYDHMMLTLHDRMKADLRYQAEAAQRQYDFAAGTTWIVFTDQVSHAAMAGQHVLEQTFLVPPERLRDPERAPLACLGRATGRTLI
jgi:hypothetical protein